MPRSTRMTLWLLALAALAAGCSGFGTTLSKVGRLGRNKGYEVAADLPIVLQASVTVLQAHGYEVSMKADPANGPESAGQIVIGQRLLHYGITPEPGRPAAPAATDLQTRDLVDVYLSKKWQFTSSQGAPNLTLVDIVGGSYLRRAPAEAEEQRPLTAAFIGQLRDEIERNVDAGRGARPMPK